MHLEEWLISKISVTVAGIVGAISALTFEEKISFTKALTMLFCGAAVSYYAQPILEHYFLLDGKYATGIGFMLGLTSMRLIRILLDSLDKLVTNVPKIALSTLNELVKKWLT